MVVKTYVKTISRMFKKHFARMCSLCFIVIISVAFISGVGESTDKLDISVTEFYKDRNISDFNIKSTSDTGFTKEQLKAIDEMYSDDEVFTFTSFDLENEEGKVYRYQYMDFENADINRLELLEGSYPKDTTQVLVERKTFELEGHKVGDVIEYNNQKYTVSGIVLNPLLIFKMEEPSYIEDKNLSGVIYFKANPYLPVTDVYVSFEDKDRFQAMSSEYEELIEERKSEYENAVEDCVVLTLYENYGIRSIITLSDSVGDIGIVLMACFMFVAALVVLSTMTRLLEEERGQIACLETLGYSDGKILGKYVMFAFAATVVGGFFGYFLGDFVAFMIYDNFHARYAMPPMTKEVNLTYYFVTLLAMVLSSMGVTYYVGKKTTSETPASILLPKPPKSGKKVFLENIPFLWKRMPFKHKSTARNILRYKTHFFMTVISIAGATALVFMGLGVLDFSLCDDTVGESLTFLALVIVLFAGMLTALVIYTLTNISISERNREIATLMVLGYYDGELAGYIYREVYVMSIIGIVFGLPFGVFALGMVFEMLGFGAIEELRLFVWLMTPVVTLAFTTIVTIMLRRKITGIDMNESLKSRE